MQGTLYVISNPLFPNYIKIGYAKCLYSRLKKLSTSVPKAYTIEYHVNLDNARKIEGELHTHYRTDLCLNRGFVSTEWYPVGPKEFFDTIEDFIKDIKERIQKVKM